MDTTRSIFAAAVRFSSGTAVSRVTGMVRDVAMAAAFGSHPSVAAFLMAFRFANLPRRLLAEGAMQSALVPTFEGLRAEDSARAARFMRDLAASLLTFLVIGMLIGEGVLWLSRGVWGVGNGEIVRLTAILLPALCFIVLYGLNTALLNCQRRYFLPSVAPAIFNLIWIAAVIGLWQVEVSVAMIGLSCLLVLGLGMQWVVTVSGARQVFKELLSGAVWGQLHLFSHDVRSLGRPLLLGIMGVGAEQINSALGPIFARAADPSGPAYLWYALRLQQLPLALFGLALAGALMPPLARAVKGGECYQQMLGAGLGKAILLMVPCTIAILATGLSAVNLVYGRGAFTLAATIETTHCLWAYGLSLAPATAIFIMAGVCYAHHQFRLPALISAVAVVCNLGLNSLFVFGLHLGAVSVALATALSSWLHCGALVWLLHRRRWGVPLGSLVNLTVRVLAASLLAWLVVVWIGGSELPRDFLGQLWSFGVRGVLFLSVLLTAGWLLHVHKPYRMYSGSSRRS